MFGISRYRPLTVRPSPAPRWVQWLLPSARSIAINDAVPPMRSRTLPSLRRLQLVWDPGIVLSAAHALEELQMESPPMQALEQALSLPRLHTLDARVVRVLDPPRALPPPRFKSCT